MTAPYVDPFAPPAPAPADEAQSAQSNVTPGPWNTPEAPKPAAPAPASSEIVLTFKEGTGYNDSAWVVVHASSVKEADALLDQSFADLLVKTKRVAAHFRGGETSTTPAQKTNAAPQGATQPPPGSPAAPGHDWVYKSGVAKAGRNAGLVWHGWMPPDHAKAAGAKPLFFDV